jgi:endonuclease/exonuclease/phosphatase (EEP) superfamily protein YafD
LRAKPDPVTRAVTRSLARLLRLAGWVVVAGLGLLAVIRAVAPDVGSPALLGLFGLGALPFLGALPVGALALVRRYLWLGLVALAVAAAALPTGLPEAGARTSLPVAARHAPTIRVLSWNLYYGNTDASSIERAVAKADADLVVLQEVSAANLPLLRRSPILAAYPHQVVSAIPSGAFGSGIWSRLPLDGSEEFDLGGLPMTRALVRTPEGPVRLINVHTLSPIAKGGPATWTRQLRSLGQEARRPGPPVLLAGDFNATWGHRPFRRLLDAGLDDAAAALGRPWTPTWRAGGRLPPALRLDHVLTGPGLVATSYATGPAAGSDHRSIVVDVAFTAPPP